MPHLITFIKTELSNRKQLKQLQEVNESVIKYLLLSKLRQSAEDNKIETSVVYKDFSKSNISHLSISELTMQLLILQENGYITLKPYGEHIDIENYALPVVLNRSILTYFKDKKAAKIAERNSKIKLWIPIIISTLALIVSFLSLNR